MCSCHTPSVTGTIWEKYTGPSQSLTRPTPWRGIALSAISSIRLAEDLSHSRLAALQAWPISVKNRCSSSASSGPSTGSPPGPSSSGPAGSAGPGSGPPGPGFTSPSSLLSLGGPRPPPRRNLVATPRRLTPSGLRRFWFFDGPGRFRLMGTVYVWVACVRVHARARVGTRILLFASCPATSDSTPIITLAS